MATDAVFPGYRTISIRESVYHELMHIRQTTGKTLTEIIHEAVQSTSHPQETR